MKFKYYSTLNIISVEINQKRYFYDIEHGEFCSMDIEPLPDSFEYAYYVVSLLYIKLHYPKFLDVLEREMRCK